MVMCVSDSTPVRESAVRCGIERAVGDRFGDRTVCLNRPFEFASSRLTSDLLINSEPADLRTP